MSVTRGSVHLLVGAGVEGLASALADALDGTGTTAESVAGPEPALARLDDGDVRTVLVDDDSLDGLDLFGSLRDGHGSVPVVLLAADPDPEHVETALTAGVTDYVRADLPTGLLAAKLEAYAERWPTDATAAADRWDDIAGTVAHDVKNPLNVISGRLELLDVEEPHADALSRSVDRIETLVDELSTAVHAGRPVTDTEPVTIADAAADAWEDADREGARLDVTTTATVEADPDRLELLFERLFENAITHGDGTATVTVGDSEAGFYVADDGPGIPPEHRGRVFEQGFGTADGEGYGLFLAETAARAHGWTVSVGEGDAGGTRVDVTT